MKKGILKMNIPKIYMLCVLLTTLIILGSYYSYAMFTVNNVKKNAVSIVTGKLSYTLSGEGLVNNQVILNANETKVIEVVIESINSIESMYQLYYENNDNIEIKYKEGTDLPRQERIESHLNENDTKKTVLVIKNKSNSEQTVTMGVQGGLVGRTLKLDNGKTAIEAIASYHIATTSVKGGTINVDSLASYGANVTINTNPAANFIYYGATIKDSNGTVLQRLDENSTSFSMPVQDVVVSPIWKYEDRQILRINESIPVPGFWSIGKSNNSNIDVQFFDYHIAFKSLTTDFNVTEIWSAQTYDLTEYSQLAIFGYGTATDGYYLMAGVTENKDTSTWLWEGINHQDMVAYDTHTYVYLDINDLTGNYYLGIGINTNSQEFEGFISGVTLKGKIYE